MIKRAIAIGVTCLGLGVAGGYRIPKDPVVKEVTVTATPSHTARTAFTRDNILVLLNEERIKLNLPMFIENVEYDEFSQEVSERLSLSGTCTHDVIREYINKRDPRVVSMAENLACDYSGADTSVQALMDSPTHRESIVNPRYTRVGIGVTGKTVVVHLYEN